MFEQITCETEYIRLLNSKKRLAAYAKHEEEELLKDEAQDVMMMACALVLRVKCIDVYGHGYGGSGRGLIIPLFWMRELQQLSTA